MKSHNPKDLRLRIRPLLRKYLWYLMEENVISISFVRWETKSEELK